MTESFDALVVGAGPTGLACGIELQNRGASKTVLVEKGCVVNSLYNYPTNMTFFTTPELLEIGNIPMTSLNDKPNRTRLSSTIAALPTITTWISASTRRWIASRARTTRSRSLPPTAWAAPHVYQARKIVLATGYYDVPNLLNVPGEESGKSPALLQRAASVL